MTMLSVTMKKAFYKSCCSNSNYREMCETRESSDCSNSPTSSANHSELRSCCQRKQMYPKSESDLEIR